MERPIESRKSIITQLVYTDVFQAKGIYVNEVTVVNTVCEMKWNESAVI